MSNDPKSPDPNDADDATDDFEVGEEFAPTMALDVSDIPELGGGAGDDDDDEAESTVQMSAGDAQAFLERMESERAGGGAAASSGRQTLLEAPEEVRGVIAKIQSEARASSTGRPIARTVAESAVPVAESLRTGASPAAAPRPGAPAPGPTTAPNPTIDGPSTRPAPAIPKTAIGSPLNAPPPSAPLATTRQDDALALVGEVSDPNTKLLLGLIVGVAVLLIAAVVGIVILVVG